MSRKPSRTTPASRGVTSMVPGTRGFDAAADLVHREMEAAGMSVSELAERSGVLRESLSYWLNGRRPLRADYLLAILAALNLEIVTRR
jgi:DNA-binding phage protein